MFNNIFPLIKVRTLLPLVPASPQRSAILLHNMMEVFRLPITLKKVQFCNITDHCLFCNITVLDKLNESIFNQKKNDINSWPNSKTSSKTLLGLVSVGHGLIVPIASTLMKWFELYVHQVMQCYSLIVSLFEFVQVRDLGFSVTVHAASSHLKKGKRLYNTKSCRAMKYCMLNLNHLGGWGFSFRVISL